MIIKIIIGSAIIVIVLIVLAMRNHYHKNIGWSDFRRFFNVLLDDCVDGSLLIIEHEVSKIFIQFAKYPSSDSSQILHFAFPNAPWSQKYFKLLEKSLKENGYDLRLEKTDSELVTEFIEVDLSGQLTELVAEGEKLAHIVLRVLDLGEESVFKLHFEGKLVKETKGDRPR